MRNCAIIHPLHLELETALLIPCSDERVDFVEIVESPTGWIFP